MNLRDTSHSCNPSVIAPENQSRPGTTYSLNFVPLNRVQLVLSALQLQMTLNSLKLVILSANDLP